ncbi:MAG: hypothetical protein HN576_06380 [Bacteriovoracaceae bacterium]|jgi:hypothetical protein|nr:hypothetical protein [Bacteriovoracaceae bacterium]
MRLFLYSFLVSTIVFTPVSYGGVGSFFSDINDRITNPSMAKTRIKKKIQFLKTQKRSIERKRGDLRDTLKELLQAENDVYIMKNLLDCLAGESNINAYSYNIISDDSMRDRKRTLQMLAKITDKDKTKACDTSEFSSRAKIIRKRTRSSEKTPEIYVVNRSDVVVYSEQDIRDLFEYYIGMHKNVIILYENFAREIGQIINIATVRMKNEELQIPVAIVEKLTGQHALSLSKVLNLSTILLEQGGESGKDPLYSFKSIDEFNILTKQISGVDGLNIYLPSLEVDGIAPFTLNDKPVELKLPETFRFSETAIRKAKEIENLGDMVTPDSEIEANLEESINEFVGLVKQYIDELKALKRSL